MRRAEPWLALFYACYRVRSNGWGWACWERIALPGAGGIAEQPAKDLAALEHMEAVANELLWARLPKRRGAEG